MRRCGGLCYYHLSYYENSATSEKTYTTESIIFR